MKNQWSITNVEGEKRDEAFAFIAAQFEQHFGATISDDSDELYAIYNNCGELDAAFGLNRRRENFFSNYYVDNLNRRLQDTFPDLLTTEKTVEFVHFSVRTPRLVCQLLPCLAEFLSLQTELLVCTATCELAAFFERKGIAPHILGKASLQQLPENLQHGWGSYYEHSPTVLLGQPHKAVNQADRIYA